MRYVRIEYKKPLQGSVTAPASKSYTQRALIASSLAYGESEIENPSLSDDSIVMKNALKLYGVNLSEEDNKWIVKGGEINAPNDIVRCGLSGATIRFLTAFSAQTKGGYSVLTGDEGLRRRPLAPLLNAINALGGWAVSARENGKPPVIIRGGRLKGGKVRISGKLSSQFVSALLLSSPVSKEDTLIEVEDLVSKPYVDMTIATMSYFNAKVKRRGYEEFYVKALEYSPSKFKVPGDYSSASFLLVGALLTEGDVTIKGLNPGLPQADFKIVEIIREVGGKVIERGDEIRVLGTRDIVGGRFDLSNSPDLLPIVAVIGLKSKTPVEITGVTHTRIKESDRITAISSELRKLGAKVEEKEDGLIVHPIREAKECVLKGWGDHRIVMALTIACLSLNVKCLISDPGSINKSYPNFFDDLSQLGAEIRWVGSGDRA